MRIFLAIIYTIFTALIIAVSTPLSMVVGAIINIKGCIQTYAHGVRKIVKGDENEISKERNKEETEPVFKDLGI